ncbi:hypothetical protein [Nostoc sp. 106C]|nr:hypothetical protein [Nostoc sp. 106C]
MGKELSGKIIYYAIADNTNVAPKNNNTQAATYLVISSAFSFTRGYTD